MKQSGFSVNLKFSNAVSGTRWRPSQNHRANHRNYSKFRVTFSKSLIMESHMDFSDTSYVRWTLLQMVLSLVGYVWFYKFLRQKFIKNPTAPELCCRSVTFVHGIISCTCAIYYVVLPALGYYKGESFMALHITPHSFLLKTSFAFLKLIKERAKTQLRHTTT